ncbi:sensor histidine kinase [Thermopolyspora sp. NPDC052614]|uniref:sensor histidine kinase n=1 Tax=Thermopolyspora sp. NPDC052614 TaxID=3155682 RepID=UPI003426DA83
MKWRHLLSSAASRNRFPRPLDWLIAMVVGTFAVTEELTGGSDLPERPILALWVAGGVAAAVLVLVRRRWPLTTMTIYWCASLVIFLYDGYPAAWQWYVQLIFFFTVCAEVPLRSPRGVLGVALTALFLHGMAISVPVTSNAEYAIGIVMAAIAGGAGLAVRRYQQFANAADERSELLAARSELLAREAVAEERTRLARELHDIVAHSVSVMVMQAGGVRLMLRPDQVKERETLAVIEETGRGAVEELRRMLGLLRGPEVDGLTPQPGLARLDDLVEQVRGAGLTVKVDIEGDPAPLPAGLDLSAYRIIQEALTNTLKHAGSTDATIKISYRPTELRLTITDAGPRGPAPLGLPARPGGHGLIGMRERAALFKGTLTTGPRPGGGYTVQAALPLTPR